MQKNRINYKLALEALTSKGKFYIDLGIDRISRVLSFLGNPQNNLKIIHIAGTNGKGSTAMMIASILTKAGYKTGLYTSPHLVNYTERIKINLNDISKETFTDLFFEVNEIIKKQKIHLTEFEILTTMMYLHFYRKKIDYAIVEVGLGGRLDATNCMQKSEVSIITSISLDHTDRLGNTIERIALEKAGIIKEKTPVIISENNKGIDIILKKANQCETKVYTTKNIDPDNYNLALKGDFQAQNLGLVLKTIEILNLNITNETIILALADVQWPARFQYFKDKNIIIDGAHNEDAATVLRESLDKTFPFQKRIWIYASMNTKDFRKITEILFSPEDEVILTTFSSENCVNPEIIKDYLIKNTNVNKIYITKNSTETVNFYYKNFTNAHIGIVAGSLWLCGKFLSHMGR